VDKSSLTESYCVPEEQICVGYSKSSGSVFRRNAICMQVMEAWNCLFVDLFIWRRVRAPDPCKSV